MLQIATLWISSISYIYCIYLLISILSLDWQTYHYFWPCFFRKKWERSRRRRRKRRGRRKRIQDYEFHIYVCLCVCVRARVCALSAQSCLTLRPHGLKPARLLCPWDFPGKNTGVGCHFLIQRIFPTQKIKPVSPASPAVAGEFFTTAAPGKPICMCIDTYVFNHYFQISNIKLWQRKHSVDYASIKFGFPCGSAG